MEIRFKAIVDTMREMAMIRFAQILGVFLILTSCGSGSSFNQIFVTSEDKNRTDSLFLQAKAAFDNGNFDDAIEKLNKATENKSGICSIESMGFVRKNRSYPCVTHEKTRYYWE